MRNVLRTSLTASILALALASAVTTASAQSEEVIHRCLGPSAELSHAASDAWRTALLSRRQGDAREQDMLVQLFAFAGAARFTGELVSRHDAPRDELRESLESLHVLSGGVDRALDAARASTEVRRAWEKVGRELTDLEQAFWGSAGTAGGTSTGTGTGGSTGSGSGTGGGTSTGGSTGSGSGSTGGTTTRDPDKPLVTITEARAGGNFFTPDLVVKGTLEGKGLDRGEILLIGKSGEVGYRDSKTLADAIAAQAATVPRDKVATVTWSVRIPNDNVPKGEITIRVTTVDRRANEGRAETKATIRSF